MTIEPSTSLFNELTNDLLPKFRSNNRVGFLISGGFDSGLLLYASCLICKQNDIIPNFVILTVPRYDDSVVHSNRIVSWINSSFDLSLHPMVVGNPDLHHSQQVLSGLQEAHKKNLADLFLLADTANPPTLPNGPIRNRSPITCILPTLV